MNFKINERVLWRNERNSLMLLHPVSKRLLIYGKGISDAVSKNGIVRTEDLPNFSDALLRDGIVLPYEGSLENESFGSDPEISAPLNVTIQVTNRCNLKCAHCHRVDKGQIDIHYERLTQIIDELAEMRVFNVNVSGGEPLMYDRIFDVVAYVASKGMKVTMSTNLMLWNAGIAKRFFDMGLRQLHISLDSADENQHNKIR